jgi:hypothetical protein
MRRISALANLAVAAVFLCACGFAPRPKHGDKPSPLTSTTSSGGESAAAGGDPDALPRARAIAMNDRTGTAVTARTSVVSGEHVSQSTPTDSGGEMATVTSGRLDTNVSGSVTVTDGTGALNVIVDSGAVTATVTDGSGALNTIVDSSALPTGASTSALQTAGNASLSSMDTKTLAAGQATMAASSPVVIASNQSAVPVTDGSGAMNVIVDSGAITATVSDGSGALNTIVDSGSVAVTSVIPGTGATNLGKAEDSAPGATDTGVVLLGVRRNTAASSSSTDGDYVTSGFTAFGELYTFDEGANTTLATISSRLTQHAENNAHATINTSSDTTSSSIDVRQYDEIWIEFELSVTATGTIEIWGAASLAGLSTLTSQRGLPLYDVLEVGSACSHADGDRLVTVAFTSGSGNAVCSVRIPGPPPYLAVRWDQASGGGGSGLIVNTFAR